MKSRWLSLGLVTVQLVCIAALLLGGNVLAAPPWVFLQVAGLALVSWAVLTMRPQPVTPWPEVPRGARLVTRGPYRWVRHPMYTGVLCLTLAWVLDDVTWGRAAVWLTLLACLLVKLEYEERLLARRFPEYAAYRKRTKRLIPYVY